MLLKAVETGVPVIDVPNVALGLAKSIKLAVATHGEAGLEATYVDALTPAPRGALFPSSKSSKFTTPLAQQ